MNLLLIIRHAELAAPFSYYQLSALGTTPDGLYSELTAQPKSQALPTHSFELVRLFASI